MITILAVEICTKHWGVGVRNTIRFDSLLVGKQGEMMVVYDSMLLTKASLASCRWASLKLKQE